MKQGKQLEKNDGGMASGGILTRPYDVTPLTMKGEKLTVQGMGITPRAPTPSTPAEPTPGATPDRSSRSSLTSDDDVTRSIDDEEADEMLQGVVSMNKILEGQIETLRLRLQVEDKQHLEDKNKLRREKDGVIQSKECEVEDLKDSLTNRDERIHHLVKAGQEKDRTIQDKVSEIDDLKKMVRQTEEIAHKLHRQIGQVKHKKEALETDTLYKEQNEEIGRLSEEMTELKKRLSGMEQELQRAAKIMEQQTCRIQQLEKERGNMSAHFKEELDKATRAMRQEVERMRAVMRQNYEEMRQLREQNRQMHNDVRDIKYLLMNPKTPEPTSSRTYRPTDPERPFTASSMTLLPVNNTARSPQPSKWTPHQRRPNLAVRSSTSGEFAQSPSARGNVTSRPVYTRTTAAAGSPQARKLSAATPAAKAAEHPRVTPAICGLKEGASALPSINRQPTILQARSKTALRLSSEKAAKK
ncbi:hypothetical protein ACOMHN_002329 [Nucella lapillus]